MNRRWAWVLLALAGVATLVFLPGASAQATECPVVQITDPSGDVDVSPPPTGSAEPFNEIDVVAGCVLEETETAVILRIDASATIDNALATQVFNYHFNFVFANESVSASVQVDSDSVTASGAASEASADGTTLLITVPKANINYNAAKVGQPFTQMFVATDGQEVPPAAGGVITASDRAPDADFGLNYTAGTLAPPTQDTDGDGAPDRDEIANGTDPAALDSDFDGLLDGTDRTIAEDNETAQDYLDAGIYVVARSGGQITFGGERTLGSNASLPDTDGDGLLDGGTVSTPVGSEREQNLAALGAVPARVENGVAIFLGELDFGADPTRTDSDADGVDDAQEASGSENPYQNTSSFPGYPGSTDPANPDSDGDGLTDGEEIADLGTDPNAEDTDGDGLTDREELEGEVEGTTFPPTDPTNEDTDGDGSTDDDEVQFGSDPTDPLSHPSGPVQTSSDTSDLLYAGLSTALLLALVFLAVLGILVRWS